MGEDVQEQVAGCLPCTAVRLSVIVLPRSLPIAIGRGPGCHFHPGWEGGGVASVWPLIDAASKLDKGDSGSEAGETDNLNVCLFRPHRVTCQGTLWIFCL